MSEKRTLILIDHVLLRQRAFRESHEMNLIFATHGGIPLPLSPEHFQACQELAVAHIDNMGPDHHDCHCDPCAAVGCLMDELYAEIEANPFKNVMDETPADDKLQDLQNQIHQLNAENRLRIFTSNEATILADIASLKAENEALRNDLDTLQDDVENLRDKDEDNDIQEEVASVQVDCQNVKDEIDEVRASHDALSLEVASLKTKSHELGQVAQELDEVRDDMASLTADVELLQEKGEDAKDEFGNFKDEMMEEQADLVRKLEDLTSEVQVGQAAILAGIERHASNLPTASLPKLAPQEATTTTTIPTAGAAGAHSSTPLGSSFPTPTADSIASENSTPAPNPPADPYAKVFSHIVNTLHSIESRLNGGRLHHTDVAGLLGLDNIGAGTNEDLLQTVYEQTETMSELKRKVNSLVETFKTALKERETSNEKKAKDQAEEEATNPAVEEATKPAVSSGDDNATRRDVEKSVKTAREECEEASYQMETSEAVWNLMNDLRNKGRLGNGISALLKEPVESCKTSLYGDHKACRSVVCADVSSAREAYEERFEEWRRLDKEAKMGTTAVVAQPPIDNPAGESSDNASTSSWVTVGAQ